MTPRLLTGESYAAVADAADRLEKGSDDPLYRVAASWLNSENPGETMARIDQQISIAQAAGASLLIERADEFFTPRTSGRARSGEPLVSLQSLVQKFAQAHIPLIFSLEDETLAERAADQTGWALTIAG